MIWTKGLKMKKKTDIKLDYSKDETFLRLFMKELSATVCLFPNGNVVYRVMKSVEHCKAASLKIAAFINDCGYIGVKGVYGIRNIRATINLGFPIELEEFIACKELRGRM
jgi:TATA-box binding protein (TBP) (component of TFIID and TFIIIB)